MRLTQIYFQKQSKFNNLCLVHAINNLVGNSVATQKQLNKLCTDLSSNFINPHKHIFGGDYDANVLILALQNLGYHTKWLDNRQEQTIINDSMVFKEERIGYIINQQCQSNWFKKNLGISDRHWIALRYIDGIYYELDSKKEAKQIRQIEKITYYLQNEIKLGSHIIQVLTEERVQKQQK